MAPGIGLFGDALVQRSLGLVLGTNGSPMMLTWIVLAAAASTEEKHPAAVDGVKFGRKRRRRAAQGKHAMIRPAKL
jgi:hypothetical protein